MMMIILHDVAGHAEEYNYVFNLYDIYIYTCCIYASIVSGGGVGCFLDDSNLNSFTVECWTLRG